MTSAKPWIAVAITEDNRMWGGHFGMAPYYALYDRQGNLVERRFNPHGAGHAHGHHDDPRRIVALLSDCGVFIGRRMGEASRRRLVTQMGVEAVLTTERDPQAAVRAYLDSLSAM